eukprot:4291626-Pyramimonas_sp.AAC.1
MPPCPSSVIPCHPTDKPLRCIRWCCCSLPLRGSRWWRNASFVPRGKLRRCSPRPPKRSICQQIG